MSIGQRVDPYRNFRFRVEFDGIIQAGFSDATIPDSTIDAVGYREGNEPTNVGKLPGLAKHGVLTLKRGMTGSVARAIF